MLSKMLLSNCVHPPYIPLFTSCIHLASSLKASGHWENHLSAKNPSTLSWWRRMRPETGRNLGGSVRLDCEMAPQIATLPNVFMFDSTVSNHSPPTWGEKNELASKWNTMCMVTVKAMCTSTYSWYKMFFVGTSRRYWIKFSKRTKIVKSDKRSNKSGTGKS